MKFFTITFAILISLSTANISLAQATCNPAVQNCR